MGGQTQWLLTWRLRINVELMPSMQGFHKKVDSEFGQVEAKAGKSGQKSGGKFSGAFGGAVGGLGKAVKWAGIIGGAAGVGLSAGQMFVGGWNRLVNKQMAVKTLESMKMAPAQIESVMGMAQRAVKGTAFALDEAAVSAAGLANAGVSMQEMPKYLTLMADTAARGKTTLGEIGPIIQNVFGKGSLRLEELNRLQDRQILSLNDVAKHYKVSGTEAAKMMTDGKVSAEDFVKILDGKVSGSAKKMGETFSGAKDNAISALNRIGETLLTPVFTAAPPVLGKITEGLDWINDRIGPALGGLKDGLAGAFGGVDVSPLEGIKSFFADLWEKVSGPLTSIGDTIREDVWPTLQRLGEWAAGMGQTFLGVWRDASPVISTVAGFVGGALATGFNVVAGLVGGLSIALGAVTDFFREHETIAKVVAGILAAVLAPQLIVVTVLLGAMGLAALKSAGQQAWAWATSVAKAVWGAGVSLVQSALVVGGWVAMGAKAVAQGAVIAGAWVASVARAGVAIAMTGAYAIAQGAAAVATGIWTAAQWLLNSAFLASPLTWIVIAIMAVVAVVVLIATKTTWFQTVWKAAWDGIKAAAAAVWGWISGSLWPGIKGVVEKLAAVATWLWQNVMVPVWAGIQNAIQTSKDVIAGIVEGVKAIFQSVADKVTEVKDGIVGRFTDVVDFIKELPGKITDAAKGMWDGITAAFKEMINFLIRGWNEFSDKVSFKVPDIPGVPRRGETIRPIPKIDELAAGGRVRAGKRRDGLLFGPGTGTSDSILGLDDLGVPTALVSPGEFVVNAAAARRWLPLLTAINGGNGNGKTGPVPAFAAGGLVPGAALPARPGEGGLKPISVLVRRLIMTAWEQITDIGGYRASDPFPDHPSGQALDIMLTDVALGDTVKAWLMDNQSAFDLNYTIWQQKYHPASGSASLMEDRGSPTQNHLDHIHALFGKIGSPPNVNPDIVPQGISWPADMRPESASAAPESASAAPEAVEGSWDDTDSAPAEAAPAEETQKDKSSISGIFGDAMKEQMGDLLDFFSIPDSPSLLAAYNEYDKSKTDAGASSGDGRGQPDPAAEAEAKRKYEDLAVQRKRAHEDDLAKLDKEYADKIAATKDAAHKRKLREELTAKKRDLKRKFEDAERAEKRKFEDEKRQRAESAKTPRSQGAIAPAPDDPTAGSGMPDTATTGPAADPNTPPTVVWKQGDGPEPWRPVLEWGINRVGKGLTNAAAQVDAGVKQIGSESGGDPNIAQQIADSNGSGDAAGVGLLQIIPRTWAAHRDPDLPDDRRHGPANIVGALRYYVGRYGPDLTKMWGHNRGYKTGGYTGNLGVNEVAGHVHGREFVVNAAATARWRPELEAMNSGARPAELASAGVGGRGTYAPVTNAVFRDEDAYYERRKREDRIAAARMK